MSYIESNNSRKPYWLIPISFLLGLLLIILNIFFNSLSPVEPEYWIDLPRLSNIQRTVAGLVVFVLAGFFGMKLTNYFILLRVYGRALFFMLLLIFTCSFFYEWDRFIPCILLELWALACLYSTYQQSSAPDHCFSLGLSLGIAAMIWLPSLWLLPFFIIELYFMRSFSLRNILAIIIGAITPLWIFIPVFTALPTLGLKDYYIENLNLLTSLDFIWHYNEGYFFWYLYPLVLILIHIIGLVYLYSSYWQERVKNRTLLFSASRTTTYLMTLAMFTGPSYKGMLFLSIIPLGILSARALSKVRHKLDRYLITIIIILSIASIILPLFL